MPLTFNRGSLCFEGDLDNRCRDEEFVAQSQDIEGVIGLEYSSRVLGARCVRRHKETTSNETEDDRQLARRHFQCIPNK